MVTLALGDYRLEHGQTVVGWVRSAEECLIWADVPFLRLSPAVLDDWHAQQGIVPCVGLVDGDLCAYGQVIEDRAEDAAEIARVIVAPERRGQAVGRTFAALLAAEAQRRGFQSIVARAARGDRATFACYRGAGFVRMSLSEEASLNLDEEREYVWLRFGSAAS